MFRFEHTALTHALALAGAFSFLGGCIVHTAYQPLEVERLAPDPRAFAAPLAPGELALEKVRDKSAWPSLAVPIPDRPALVRAIERSLHYLAKPSARRYYPYLDVDHARVVRSLELFRDLLTSGLGPAALERELRARFELYRSKGRAHTGEVLFTAYCEPIYDASRTPSARFRYPLYRRPADLVSDAEGRCLGRRLLNGRLVAYFTRREIDEGGALRGRGLELVWLRDPFEAFLVHVQGSARLRLVDEGGRLLPVGYAGKTDRPYRSVGKALVRDGKLEPEEVSLAALKRYFRDHPAELLPYLYENESYVFFRVSEGGPYGSLNEPVTPEVTIATDKAVFPRAALAFVEAAVPRTPTGPPRPFRRFCLDQDTGGAIRSAGRADIFLGTGPEAEARAGRTRAVGRLFYLFVKP